MDRVFEVVLMILLLRNLVLKKIVVFLIGGSNFREVDFNFFVCLV